MVNLRCNESGYIALLSVLIIGAAAVAISLALLMTGTDSQRAAVITQQSAQARALAVACATEGLQKIQEGTSFTGSGGLSMGQGTCTYTVSSTGASTRTVTASGTVGNVVRKVEAYVTIGASNISVTSWQEVS